MKFAALWAVGSVALLQCVTGTCEKPGRYEMEQIEKYDKQRAQYGLFDDHYELLGVSENPNETKWDKTLKKAYNRKALASHPDRVKQVDKDGEPLDKDLVKFQRREAAAMFNKINTANENLKDPTKRQAYNVRLGIQRSRTPDWAFCAKCCWMLVEVHEQPVCQHNESCKSLNQMFIEHKTSKEREQKWMKRRTKWLKIGHGRDVRLRLLTDFGIELVDGTELYSACVKNPQFLKGIKEDYGPSENPLKDGDDDNIVDNMVLVYGPDVDSPPSPEQRAELDAFTANMKKLETFIEAQDLEKFPYVGLL